MNNVIARQRTSSCVRCKEVRSQRHTALAYSASVMRIAVFTVQNSAKHSALLGSS